MEANTETYVQMTTYINVETKEECVLISFRDASHHLPYKRELVQESRLVA
jgi:hypothetical protein